MAGIDFIGDIHGDATAFSELLYQLGYSWDGKPPSGRKAIILGDAFNRGPRNKAMKAILQKMIGHGASFVLGNHEFLLNAYSTKSGNGYARSHTEENTNYHADVLREFPFGTDEHQKLINWLKKAPLYLRTSEYVAIHACPDFPAVSYCKKLLSKDNRFKDDAYIAYHQGRKNPYYNPLQRLVIGPTWRLPYDLSFVNATGAEKRSARVFWWNIGDKNRSLSELLEGAQQYGDKLSPMQELLLRATLNNKFSYASRGLPPVFFGHYNLPGTPRLTHPRFACLNFQGHIVAYRWKEGETELSPNKLVSVPRSDFH
jgi:hypothetical protein